MEEQEFSHLEDSISLLTGSPFSAQQLIIHTPQSGSSSGFPAHNQFQTPSALASKPCIT